MICYKPTNVSGLNLNTVPPSFRPLPVLPFANPILINGDQLRMLTHFISQGGQGFSDCNIIRRGYRSDTGPFSFTVIDPADCIHYCLKPLNIKMNEFL